MAVTKEDLFSKKDKWSPFLDLLQKCKVYRGLLPWIFALLKPYKRISSVLATNYSHKMSFQKDLHCIIVNQFYHSFSMECSWGWKFVVYKEMCGVRRKWFLFILTAMIFSDIHSLKIFKYSFQGEKMQYFGTKKFTCLLLQ